MILPFLYAKMRGPGVEWHHFSFCAWRRAAMLLWVCIPYGFCCAALPGALNAEEECLAGAVASCQEKKKNALVNGLLSVTHTVSFAGTSSYSTWQ